MVGVLIVGISAPSVQYPALKYSDGTLMPNQVRELPEEPAQVDIASPIVCSTADIDQDNDGLIEICDLEGLNAVRHQLDGSGYRVNGSATKITAGCARGGCKGYELSKDLDFDDDASYSNVANKVTWTTGSGWQPIGTSSNPFNATFRANKHSISKLMIARSSFSQAGLFRKIGNQARIEGVGLIDADVRGDEGVGGLVGYNSGGTIINSYVTGIVRGDDSVGGLVGDNYGPITNSYTNVEMSGNDYIGGIVGCNLSGGIVTNSYTVPRINRSSSSSGGLLGANSGSRSINSYWDKEVSGISSGDYGVGLTTAELQSPTTTTGIYSRWSTNAWDFGTNEQYPALKYRDGTLMPNQGREIPEELPQIEIAGVPTSAVNEGESITLTASSTSSASSIALIYHWQQTSGKILLTSPTSGSSVTLDVPEDYVVVGENTGNVELILEAINDVGSTTQQVSITITKRNNGGIAALSIPNLNERELTAPSIDISGDPDGSGSNIRYQWQSRQSTQTAWINVPAAGTNERYTIPADTTGIVQYRVVVSYTDGQGYREEVLSGEVIYERIIVPQPSIEIASLTSCGTADIDQDDDGLIEICNLEGLNAIRHQLDGSGYRVSSSTVKITAGCAEDGCKGYELDEDLDFNDDASYSNVANKVTWTTGSGWQPIGSSTNAFRTTFEGNSYTISNLLVNKPNTNNVGLFGYAKEGTISSVALSNVDIKGNNQVGGLAGHSGNIGNSYATGTVVGKRNVGGLVGISGRNITNSYATGSVEGREYVGGLVGFLSRVHVMNSYAMSTVTGDGDGVGGLVGFGTDYGKIANSYAMSTVTGDNSVGGLAGWFYGVIASSYAMSSVEGDTLVGGLIGYATGGTIDNSYATGAVKGTSSVGGLVGLNWHRTSNSYATGTVEGERNVGGLVGLNRSINTMNSYWDKETSRQTRSASGTAKTTEQLQSPTTTTGIYSRWSTNAWDFGSNEQYPALKYRDGTLMPNQVRERPEEPAQIPQIEIAGVPTGAVDEGESITLTASSTSSASSVPLIYQWQQTSGKTLLTSPSSRSSVTLNVPEDYIVVGENTGNVVLILEASNDVGSTTQQVSITIAKRNNGGIAALGVPNLNERELTVPSIDISSDPDGGGSDIGYQWQIRQSTQTAWVDVPTVANTKETYTIPEETRNGTQYHVVVSYTDGQGYEEEVMSEAVIYERIIVPQPSIDIASLTSCGTADIDQDDDGLIEICDLEGLNAMRYQLDGSGYKASESATKITAGCAEGGCKGYELDEDLDFDSDASYSSTPNKVIWTTGSGWEPIGYYESYNSANNKPFAAIFEGNNYTISNLMIDRSNTRGVGLFSSIEEGTIMNVGLLNLDIIGRSNVGGLIGRNIGSVLDSYVTGSVEGYGHIGGLIGVNVGNITNSYATGSVRGEDLSIGGLIGFSGGGLITNSYATGSVEGHYMVGGLVGSSYTTIKNSYATGSVNGDQRAGGLVGDSHRNIWSSYATGSVNGGREVGGLVGLNYYRTIIDSYATGSVNGGQEVGGLVGSNYGRVSNSYATGSVEGNIAVGGLVGSFSRGTIRSSYWDKTTSGMSRSARGVGKTTEELQSPTTSTGIYGSWSTNNWDFGTNEQYPALKYSDGTLMPNQGRERPEEPAQMPQIEIVGVPTGAVDEGESITLTASSTSSASSIPLIYYWMQTSGKTLLTSPTSGSSVTLDVPEDYVVESENIGNVVLMLEASNDVGSTAQQVLITITKRNDGGIATLGVPALNERELTAPSIDISGDPDGSGSNIVYQWQSRQSAQAAWINVPAAGTNERYTIPADITGIVEYRVVVSYTDGQGYGEEVLSGAVIYERRVAPQPSIEIASLTSCGTADIDQDDDGLIEICNLEGLNAIRHQLDGSGYKVSAAATKITAGCAEDGCKGYELDEDLDFDSDASYSSTPNKVIWTTGSGWEPIGYYEASNRTNNKPFTATFEGNNHIISNLMVDRSNTNNVGLFGFIERGTINNVGLSNINIKGNRYVSGLVSRIWYGTITNSYVMGSVSGGYRVGGLVGENWDSSITNSYATGNVVGGSDVGGLVGKIFGGSHITNSYATGSVSGDDHVGGLVGVNWGGTITNSYATGDVVGINLVGGLVGGQNREGTVRNSYAIGSVEGEDDVGGLVGHNWQGPIMNSYSDKTTSGMSSNGGGVGKTTEELQSPTTSTGIYSSWSTNDWDFGTREQYPALKYSDGTLMPNQVRERPEEPAQIPQIEIAGVPTGAVNEGESITLTASSTSSASNISLTYQWQQTSGKTLLTSPTSGSSVTLDVPEDYVAASENTGNVVLMLEASNDVGSTTQQVSITIAKRNNGGIAALGVPNLNERELTVPSIDISSDPDGGGSDIGYQWQIRQSTQTAWVDVPTVANTKETYTIPEETRNGTQYRVVVSYTDGQGYGEEVLSGAVIYERRVAPQPSIDIASLTSCGTADIDQDDDGLIEICNLEGLNAMRHQLDGSGYKASASATKITAGCAEGGCKGYELNKDLDFNDYDSYSSTPNKVIWTTGAGWQPIGTSDNPFDAIFRANKYSISNLMIARSSFDEVGLFGRIESQARIEGVGLINVDVRGNWGVGGLVGFNTEGTITNSYVIGSVRGDDSVGGLVGDNYGPITNSYTNVEMSGNNYVGGIVGCNFSGGIVTNSYTVPRINRSLSYSGGLLGYDSSRSLPVNSYWDKDVSGISSGNYGVGLPTEALQSPTTSTGIYSRWSIRDWDFGTREQYPALKYRDGTLLPNQVRERPEEPAQELQIEIAGVPVDAVNEGESITLTASSASSANNISLIYHWHQTSGKTLLTSPTSGSRVTLDVPEDYVVASENTGNVVLILEASNDVGSTAHQVLITIAKSNNGGIAALGVPTLNERELTAPSIDLSGDPDGGGNNIRYQWQSKQGTQTEWINVPAAGTNERYIIPADTAGVVAYRVVVGYTDGQGYEEQVESGSIKLQRQHNPQRRDSRCAGRVQWMKGNRLR